MGFGITGALLLAIRAVPPARLTYREGDAEPELCGEIGAIRTQDRYKRAQIRSQMRVGMQIAWRGPTIWRPIWASRGVDPLVEVMSVDVRQLPESGHGRGCVDRQPAGQVTRSSSH